MGPDKPVVAGLTDNIPPLQEYINALKQQQVGNTMELNVIQKLVCEFWAYVIGHANYQIA